MSSSSKLPQPYVQDDDEDLDDLDDILDQFGHPPKVSSTSTGKATPTSAPAAPIGSGLTSPPHTSLSPSSPSIPDDLPPEFLKNFTENMESIMREFSGVGNLGDGNEDGDEDEDREAAKKSRELFERMLVNGLNGVDLGNDGDDDDDMFLSSFGDKAKNKMKQSSSTTTTTAGPVKPPGSKDDFQKNIRQTMEKLKESDSNLKNTNTKRNNAGSSGSIDPLEKIWSDLANQLGDDNDTPENDADMQGMLESMMQQLMSKEILYEPLKELKEQFPKYLSENRDKLPQADVQRFESQLVCVNKIVELFEDPTYADDNVEKNIQVVTMMNEMQSFGAPPTEIMGPLPPGFTLGNDGMPEIPEGCVIS